MGALQCISRALPRFVNLSNRTAREFDVSLGPDGGRIIFSNVTPGDKLRVRRRADAKAGDLGQPEAERRPRTCIAAA